MRVVAAAIVRDGQVLVARRSKPAALAGGWEFPGGKIEHGESDEEALVRECAEELGVRIAVGPLIGSASDTRIDLVLYAAALVGGEPAAGADHDELAWPGPDELDAVAWLPIDRELVPPVAALLRERGG